jgi:hypothetical protein
MNTDENQQTDVLFLRVNVLTVNAIAPRAVATIPVKKTF